MQVDTDQFMVLTETVADLAGDVADIRCALGNLAAAGMRAAGLPVPAAPAPRKRPGLPAGGARYER
jgi:hypothetical protein